jgi:hypothetical protein
MTPARKLSGGLEDELEARALVAGEPVLYRFT